jgi:EpsI family protein
MRFLTNRYARVLTLLLLLQGAVFYATAMRKENVPSVQPLSLFPTELGDWQMHLDVPIEPEVLEVLKADDTLNRVYENRAHTAGAFLFVGFFKTQRYGQAPHSPKNCLPGSGWEPVDTSKIEIKVEGRAEPIVANHYLVARGDEKSVVLYWYQSHNRVIAGEFSAKFWLIADSIRYHRSDSALVKIVVPVRDGDSAQATRTAVEFAQAIYPPLSVQLPL